MARASAFTANKNISAIKDAAARKSVFTTKENNIAN
jgi:hypothetical protein